MSKRPPLAERLAKLADGLVLPSESDQPFAVVHWPSAALPTDATTFRKLVGLDAKTPVKTFDAGALLNRLGHESTADSPAIKKTKAGYRKLAAFIAEHLTDVHGFKAGTVNVETFLLGRTSEGEVLGLKAGGVET